MALSQIALIQVTLFSHGNTEFQNDVCHFMVWALLLLLLVACSSNNASVIVLSSYLYFEITVKMINAVKLDYIFR